MRLFLCNAAISLMDYIYVVWSSLAFFDAMSNEFSITANPIKGNLHNKVILSLTSNRMRSYTGEEES